MHRPLLATHLEKATARAALPEARADYGWERPTCKLGVGPSWGLGFGVRLTGFSRFVVSGLSSVPRHFALRSAGWWLPRNGDTGQPRLAPIPCIFYPLPSHKKRRRRALELRPEVSLQTRYVMLFSEPPGMPQCLSPAGHESRVVCSVVSSPWSLS